MIKLKGTNEGYVLKIDNQNALFEVVLNSLEQYLVHHPKEIVVHIEFTHPLIMKEEEIIMTLFKNYEILFKSIRYSIQEKSNMKVIERSIRCGELLQVDGDCLIIGNINPEAVIKVSGFLYIMGKVYGRVECEKGLAASLIDSNYIYIQNQHLEQKKYHHSKITYEEGFVIKTFAISEGEVLWEELLL